MAFVMASGACPSGDGGTDASLPWLDVSHGDSNGPRDIPGTDLNLEDGEEPPTDLGPGIDTIGMDIPVGTDVSNPTDHGIVDVPGKDTSEDTDVEPCDFLVSPNGFRDNCNRTLTDTRSNRTWFQHMDWATDSMAGQDYCDKSDWAGYRDWRLPTITELRSLIIGCPETTAGGTCSVTETCYCTKDERCFAEMGECRNTACYGCSINQGPGLGGCYMDPFFDDYCNLHWSSTRVPVRFAGDYRGWYVTFYDGGVNLPPTTGTNAWAVRCVRGP
jgi:hypothetical protein